jgi:hypothetical protein
MNAHSGVGASEAADYMQQFIDLIRRVHDRHQQHHYDKYLSVTAKE